MERSFGKKTFEEKDKGTQEKRSVCLQIERSKHDRVHQRIQNAFRKILSGSSLTLALIYTLGHVVIAMTVVSVMTGASLWEAGAVALIEPSINGVWFYILHTGWKKVKGY